MPPLCAPCVHVESTPVYHIRNAIAAPTQAKKNDEKFLRTMPWSNDDNCDDAWLAGARKKCACAAHAMEQGSNSEKPFWRVQKKTPWLPIARAASICGYPTPFTTMRYGIAAWSILSSVPQIVLMHVESNSFCVSESLLQFCGFLWVSILTPERLLLRRVVQLLATIFVFAYPATITSFPPPDRGLLVPHIPFVWQLPVHCAAAGGNLNILAWLVEDRCCPLFLDRAKKVISISNLHGFHLHRWFCCVVPCVLFVRPHALLSRKLPDISIFSDYGGPFAIRFLNFVEVFDGILLRNTEQVRCFTYPFMSLRANCPSTRSSFS